MCVVVLLLTLIETPVYSEQARTRSCPPGTPRDVEGFCILPAKSPARRRPPTPPGRDPTKRESSDAGDSRGQPSKTAPPSTSVDQQARPQERNETKAPPSKAATSERPRPESLQPETCPPGQQRSEGHCCSRGERWSNSAGRCVCEDLQVCGSRPPPTASPDPPPSEERGESASLADAESTAIVVPEERGRSQRIWSWVLFGSGLALGLAGMAVDISAYLETQRTEPFSSDGAMEEWAEEVERTALIGDIVLGVGLAVAVGGLIWVLVSRRNRAREPDRHSQPSVMIH